MLNQVRHPHRRSRPQAHKAGDSRTAEKTIMKVESHRIHHPDGTAFADDHEDRADSQRQTFRAQPSESKNVKALAADMLQRPSARLGLEDHRLACGLVLSAVARHHRDRTGCSDLAA
jgi:hypothetical protein